MASRMWRLAWPRLGLWGRVSCLCFLKLDVLSRESTLREGQHFMYVLATPAC